MELHSLVRYGENPILSKPSRNFQELLKFNQINCMREYETESKDFHLKMEKRLETNLLCLTSDFVDVSHSEQVERMCSEGIKFIQFRSKRLSHSDFLREVSRSAMICRGHESTLIINDSVEMAFSTSACGVHLGITDKPAEYARMQLGPGKLIGETIHTVEEAKSVKARGICDYFGLGPYRFSQTKNLLAPTLNLDQFHSIVEYMKPIPAYLIGGLKLSDFELIEKIGLSGICVCSALSNGREFGVHLSSFAKESQRLLKEPAFHE